MKSKNRNPRIRQLRIVSVMLMLLISGMLVYGLTLSNRTNVSDADATQRSMWYTNWDESTVSFMNTAIAEFTKDPTLALSSTPFYAEMVNYRVIWELTTTPLALRNRCPPGGCATYVYETTERFYQQATAEQFATDRVLWLTISPTASPLPTSTPTYTPSPRFSATPSPTPIDLCSPAIANWHLIEDMVAFTALLEEYSIDANVDMVSSGVQGIDAACQIPFQPTFSQIRVGVDVTMLDDDTILPLTITILEAIEVYVLESENISPRQLEINLAFYTTDNKGKWLRTDFASLQQASTMNLSDEEFVEAVGGFYEGDVNQ
jgi:hypothetical protein